MNTQKPSFWSRFTLKTEGQVYTENAEREAHAGRMAAPHGIRTFIEQEQRRINEVVANTDQFISDIEKHFGSHVKYLGRDYDGKSKFENIENKTRRRFAMKWTRDVFGENQKVLIGFVYTQAPKGNIRIDYLFEIGADTELAVNENYTGEDDVYKAQNRSEEAHRAIRRYEDHDQFMAQGKLPPWFKAALDQYVAPL